MTRSEIRRRLLSARGITAREGGNSLFHILAAWRRSSAYKVSFKNEPRKSGCARRYFAVRLEPPSYTATVTTQGQLTIPIELRRTLNIRAGSKVRFIEVDGRWHLEAPAALRNK